MTESPPPAPGAGPAAPAAAGSITILFVAGSGRASGELGPVPAAAEGPLRAAVAAHGGWAFARDGAAVEAAFRTPETALAAAMAAQEMLAAAPDLPPLHFALHTGVAGGRAEDYVAPVLSGGARLLSAVPPGRIWLSSATVAHVRDALPAGVALRDLGARPLIAPDAPEPVWEVVASATPEPVPAPRPRELRPNNLPVPAHACIGRERELAELRGLLHRPDARLITLTGPGGTGKTRLAAQLATNELEQFDQGAWWVDLAPVADPGLLPAAVATALQVRELPGQPLVTTLADYLQGKQLLLVLDNCAHLVGACARFATHILRQCSDVTLLVTSGAPLDLGREQVYAVGPLAVPAPDAPADPMVLAVVPAVRLFVERATAGDPAFVLTGENAPAVAAIVTRLDGMPLAIELAAAWVADLPVAEIGTHLAERFHLFVDVTGIALPRGRLVRALIDWSHERLPAPERALVRRLATFAGGWTIAAAAAVCAGDGVDAAAVPGLLTALQARAFLTAEDAAGAPRYRFRETVREYARDRLLAGSDVDTLRDRHLAAYVALAEDAEPRLRGPAQLDWLARLEADHDNLRAALACALAGEQIEIGLRLVAALGWFWRLRGNWSEARAWLERMLGHATGVRPAVHARALLAAANVAAAEGDRAAMLAWAEELLVLARDADDRIAVAEALSFLGSAARAAGDTALAESRLTEARALAGAAGDRWLLARVSLHLGTLAWGRGAHAVARTRFEDSLAGWTAVGDRWGLGMALNSLGNVAADQGDYASARAYFEDSLPAWQALGDRYAYAQTLCNLGRVALAEGRPEHAQQLYELALLAGQDLGAAYLIGVALAGQGDAARARGHFLVAEGHYAAALAVVHGAGAEWNELPLRLAHAFVVLAQGDDARAGTLLRECLALCPAGDSAGLAAALAGLGAVAGGLGRPARGARLFGAAAAVLGRLAAGLDPADRAILDPRALAARNAINPAAWAKAYAAGQALSREAALAYARGETAPFVDRRF